MNKSLLQVIGILNLVFGSILFFSIIGIAIAVPLIVSGILFLGYYNLSDEELEFKLPSIRIWSIIFIFINIISAIFGFMFLYQNKKEKKEIDMKAFKLNFLLNLGTFLILLACIMLINSSLYSVMDYIKVIVLLILSLIFFISSRFLSKNDKLKYTSYVYWVIGCILVICSFYSCGYYKLFGDLFSVTGDYNCLFMSCMFLIATGILYLSYKLYKSDMFIKISFITSYCSVAFLLAFFSLDIETFIAMFAASLLIVSLMSGYTKKQSLSKSLFRFNTVISIGYFAILMLENLLSEIELFIAIADIVYIINLFVISSKYRNNSFDIFITIIIPIIIQLYCFIYLPLQSSVIASIISFLIYYFVFYITKAKNHTFTAALIICNVLLFYNYLRAYTCTSPLLPLSAATALFGIYHSITAINKYEKRYIGELVIVPFKILLLCCAISYILSSNGFPISFLSHVVIWSNIILLFSIFTKNKILKNIYFTMAYVLVLLCVVPIHIDLVFRLDIFVMWAIGYILLTDKDKNNSLWLKPANIVFVALALLSLYSLFNYISFTIQLALLCMIMYCLIAYIFRTEKVKVFICLLFMLLPYYSLLNIVDITTSLHIVLTVLPFILYTYLFTYFFTANNRKLSFIIEVLVCLIALLTLIFEGSIESVVAVGGVSILMIILNIIKDTNSLIFVGVTTLLLNIMSNMFKYWNYISIWSYLLLGGISLVVIVTIKEIKKDKK